MFTDVRDFTSIAERLSPGELAQCLGQYLECMAAAIHATRGTIDKYIGDAVMALWNAPTPLPGHARLACRAALECRRATRELFASPAWGGAPPFETRFGLHVDTVMVGHFGAPARMSYTALGDGVNLASRLEGLNKHYGTTLLASEAVRAQVAGAFEFRLLDVVAVKGRAAGLRVYELLGAAGEPDVSRAVVGRYESALAAYQRRRFDEAATLLRPQLEDMPSRVLLERCRAALEQPPPTDWDGVHVFMTK
jgi:adenylate cyclase